MTNSSDRSILYMLEPVTRRLPQVRKPMRHVPFKEKLIWTGLALVIYLVMAQIPIYGLTGQAINYFGQLRYVLASRAGTLMQLGIGPIVTAGIVMQLLVGANILNLDLHNPQDKSLFTEVQKILALVVGGFQASIFVFSGMLSTGQSGSGMMVFMVAQLLLGVVVVLYLDELVSKYGFGSGISLFIAGGVSATVFWQAFNPLTTGGTIGGAIPNFISALIEGTPAALSDAFFRSGPSPGMMGVITTLLVFFIVLYVLNIRIEVPLSYSQYGGMRGKYPIQFVYTRNIPAILSLVMFTNFQILGRVVGDPLQHFMSYYFQSPHGLGQVMADPLRAVFYMVVLVVCCMGFAWLWIHTTNMAPADVADQLKRSGMSLPGFRRDKRTIEKMLARYIQPVTLLGGAFIGALAAGANFLGTLSTGTGILLTVGIVYRLYQEIAREQLTEMFPMARKFLGES